jgi:hypothetical protein
MTYQTFELSPEQLEQLLRDYPNMGKNSHVGNLAVKVVELYFLSIDPKAQFVAGKKGPDLIVTYNGVTEPCEIKGTVDKDIAWAKLKVSSSDCYNALVNGMTLIRVTNIGEAKMVLYFMKYGEDFNLLPEPRWSVTPLKRG